MCIKRCDSAAVIDKNVIAVAIVPFSLNYSTAVCRINGAAHTDLRNVHRIVGTACRVSIAKVAGDISSACGKRPHICAACRLLLAVLILK